MIPYALLITRSQTLDLMRHVENDFPNETCGVMAGNWRDGVGYVSEIILIPNIAQRPETTYYMDERTLATALFEIERQNRDLIGFYHSHPQGDDVPSSTDIASAAYPDAVYVIVGYKQRSPVLSAWLLNDGEAVRVELHEREGSLDLYPNSALSSAARAAILISAALAFALLVIIAVTLLPPAPILPAR